MLRIRSITRTLLVGCGLSLLVACGNAAPSGTTASSAAPSNNVAASSSAAASTAVESSSAAVSSMAEASSPAASSAAEASSAAGSGMAEASSAAGSAATSATDVSSTAGTSAGALPAGVPLYPGAQPIEPGSPMATAVDQAKQQVAAQQNVNATVQGFTLPAGTTFDQVKQFYNDALTKAGWTSGSLPGQATGGINLALWTNPSGEAMTLVVVPDPGESSRNAMVVTVAKAK